MKRFDPITFVFVVVCFGQLVCAAFADADTLVPSQTPIPRTLFGLHLHRAASTTPWPPANFGSWQLVDAYVGWLNLEQSRGRWSFEKLDRYAELASARSVDLLLPLAFPPRWASARPDEKGPYGPGTGAEPLLLEDWRTYVRTVGNRYRSTIHNYGVWDEPNEKAFYSGTLEQLIDLAGEAYRILKGFDQRNLLVSPGVVGSVEWLERYLEKGGGKYADVIGYHFYPYIGGSDKHAQQRPETMIAKVVQVRAAMKKYGVSEKPLWNTGIGFWNQNSDGTPESMAGVDSRWIKLDPELAAAWLARTYILGWALGMERVFWYSWDHENMGLIEPTTKALKPAGSAYVEIIDWLVGSIMKNCSNDRNRIWVCELSRPGKKEARIVWTETGKVVESIPATWRATHYKSLSGESRQINMASPVVQIGEQPLLIVSDSQEW